MSDNPEPVKIDFGVDISNDPTSVKIDVGVEISNDNTSVNTDSGVEVSNENICQNGGTVITGIDSASCHCGKMFTGDKCQTGIW